MDLFRITSLNLLNLSVYHYSLQWHHNGHDDISNHQPQDCLLNRLFRGRSKKTSKLRVTGLCAGNSPMTSEFPAQMASNAENVSIWWRHHVIFSPTIIQYIIIDLIGISIMTSLTSLTFQLHLHSAEEDNLSPFDSKIACLCQSIEINNNKYVYRQRQVRMPNGSGVRWAECLLIIGTGCRVQVF